MFRILNSFSHKAGDSHGELKVKAKEADVFIANYMTTGVSAKEAFVLGELLQEIHS